MKTLIYLLLIAILASCRSTQEIAMPTENVKETVKTEYVEVLKDTTIYITLPAESVDIVTHDSISILETSLATSYASNVNGELQHILRNKNGNIPTRVIYKDIVYTDSIFVDRIKSINVEVEKKLTWWQNIKIKLGGYLVIALIGIIGFIVVKRFI